jgi:uncharacterized coiled-coil DUF342 family protein
MTEQDTREKLEADVVRRFPVLYEVVMPFLDRQAAITEREQINKRIADQIGSIWMRDDIRKLKAEREELQRNVDELQAKVDRLEAAENYDCTTCCAKNALEAELNDYKASMETVEANANLWREQADKLKAENKRLSDRVNGLLLEQLIIAEKLGAENVSNKTA